MVRQEGGVYVDPKDWFRLKKDLDSFDKKLGLALRRRLHVAGNIAVAAVRSKLAMPPPGDSPDVTTGARAALIRGTTSRVSFSRRAAGVKIVTSGARLPPGHEGFLKAYNKGSFRHPVFGTDHWVEQHGRPYFGRAIEETRVPIQHEVGKALDDAVLQIGGIGT